MRVISLRRTVLVFIVGILFFAIAGNFGKVEQAQAIIAPCPPPAILSDEAQRVQFLGQINQARNLMNADQQGTKIPLLSENKDWSVRTHQHAYYVYAASDVISTVDVTTEALNLPPTNPLNTCITTAPNGGGVEAANKSMVLAADSVTPTIPTRIFIKQSLISVTSPLSPTNIITTGIEAADRYLNTIYLRSKLLAPRLQNVGYGIFPAGQKGVSSISVVDVESDSPNFGGRPAYQPAVYPAAGQQNVPVAMPCGEQPDILVDFGFTACPGRGNVGYAITVIFDPGQNFQLQFSQLLEVAGNIATPVSYVEILPNSPSIINRMKNPINPTDNFTNILALIPRNPLKGSTTYAVTVRGVLNGQSYSRQWTFTTGNFNSSNQIQPTPTTTPDFRPILIPSQTAVPTLTPTPGLPGLPVFPPPSDGSAGFFTPLPANTTNPLFFRLWERVDDPVYKGLAGRSWIYGDQSGGFTTLLEAYGTGYRLVNYHDKARIEATSPTVGFTTNGLLVREMIAGAAQVGDTIFIPRVPAQIAIAGDVAETNINAPTYVSFQNVASLNNDRRVPNQVGQTVVATIAKDGTINVNFGTGVYGVVNVYYDNNLGHNIPNVFWDYMNQSGIININGSYVNGQVVDWLPVFGLPLSEPYWTRVFVGNQEKDVLVQVFERRTLTYTPSNPPAFRVEMGNVGRHYYKWRYGLNN
jgi:hypothetical protein